MQQILNRLVNSIVAVVFALFKTSNKAQPLPPPPPLPPGVPPTPGPILPPPPGPPPIHTPLTTLLAGFAGRYNKQFVDIDKFAGAQCVDIQLAWADWIGQPRLAPVVGAGDHAGKNYAGWVWIANTPTNIPQPGDVVIWRRSPSLPWGHEAVYIRGDMMHLFTFDQNWPYDSPMHEGAHTYAGVAGWHRPVSWKGK